MYLLSSVVSIVNLYWLRELETEGLLTFLSVTWIFGLEFWIPVPLVEATLVFLELVLVSVAGKVLAGGRAERNPAGGRLVTAGLDTGAGLSEADLDLISAGFCGPWPGRSTTDLDLLFVTFPTLWLSVLVADGLGYAPPAVALDFQMDPIFDWTILPLYMPGADFDDGTAAGGFGASSTIFLCLTTCSVRNAWLCVCRCVTSVAAAPFPSLCTVFSFFRGSPDVALVSTVLALAFRGPFFVKVSSFLLLFSWKGIADVWSLLIKDLLPCAGWAFSLFP